MAIILAYNKQIHLFRNKISKKKYNNVMLKDEINIWPHNLGK